MCYFIVIVIIAGVNLSSICETGFLNTANGFVPVSAVVCGDHAETIHPVLSKFKFI